MARRRFISRIAAALVIAALLFLTCACAGPERRILQTEKDYQRAFNDVFFQGRARMEVPVKYGRVDLLADDYAIEVDLPDHFHEAIGQALHYAAETNRKPAVAFFVADRRTGDQQKLAYAMKLCERYKIQVWFINEELEKAERKRP